MSRTHLLLTLFVLTACGTCVPQLRVSVPRPARLRVTVTYDGQTKVRDATVELQDGAGFSSAMDQKVTDQDGRVEFNTTTGRHHLRIFGADFYAFEGEFEITPVENFHTEIFRVKRKTVGEATAPEGQSAVPAVRMKIPVKARKEFEKGSKSLEDQNWAASCKYFQAAIDLYPDYDLAYNGLGVARSQMNDTPAARQAFVKATQLNDKFAGAQRNLARILISEHNYDEVAFLLNQSLNVEPLNAWALTNAAYAELQLHRFKQAAGHALQVHGLPHQGLANAHMIAGYALEALGQNQQATAEFKLYLKEDSTGPNAKRAQAAIARLPASQQP
ncbi:MAG: tetratricopeptide repeat protein [Terriglobales bacterium]